GIIELIWFVVGGWLALALVFGAPLVRCLDAAYIVDFPVLTNADSSVRWKVLSTCILLKLFAPLCDRGMGYANDCRKLAIREARVFDELSVLRKWQVQAEQSAQRLFLIGGRHLQAMPEIVRNREPVG